MPQNTNVIAHIKDLELSLLSQNTRLSAETLNNLISDDFIEFGVSGKIHNKQDVINDLPNETPRTFSVENLEIKLLSDDIAMSIYHIHESNQSSLRSSLWKKNSYMWQLFFHQGTKKAQKSQ